MAADPGGRAFGVLFVCTGNICRSPTAEALARRELERSPGVPLQVSSAGSHAFEGNPAASRSLLAASTRGASLERHFARELSRCGSAGRPDPVHGRRAPPLRAQLRPLAADRTFLLASFARVVAERGWMAGSPAELVALAAEHAQVRDGDDIEDSLGQAADAYAACAERLDGLVSPVIAALVKTLPAGPGAPA